MIRSRVGKVISIIESKNGIAELEILLGSEPGRAVNYEGLTGPVNPGDRVLLNTTAVHKKLGTGGTHFVMANLTNPENDTVNEGHIMKVRYTPSQVKVLSVEEQESPYAGTMSTADSLENTPVIIGSLHSMLAPAAAAVRRECGSGVNITYLMTDGASLPLSISKLVRQLKDKGVINSTITAGNAFGGDYEAVNVYSGLLAARYVAGAHIIIAVMGPGIVGTGSPYGFTGLEQGEIVNSVNILNGQPVAIPRISFADKRERHYGLSHHTQTALGKIALSSCRVALPAMDADKNEIIKKQLAKSGIQEKHSIIEFDGSPGIDYLRENNIEVKTMGRSISEDPEFFYASSATGSLASSLL